MRHRLRMVCVPASCCCVAQELRMQNMAAIQDARRRHKDTCSDADGYDLITVPEVRKSVPEVSKSAQ